MLLMKDLTSIRDLCREDVDSLVKNALRIKKKGIGKILEDKLVATLFFEDSTRTRGKMEIGALQLGANVTGFGSEEGTSASKNESLLHTVRMYGLSWDADFIVMRHKLDGSARFITDKISTPVINGGDYNSWHPTQALQDIMTIVEFCGNIDGLKIAIGGGLLHDRAAHDLLMGLAFTNAEVYLVPPKPGSSIPDWMIEDYIKISGKEPITLPDPETAICEVKVNAYHCNRIKRERFEKGSEGDIQFARVCDKHRITPRILEGGKKGLIVMDPLPIDKTHPSIDPTLDEAPQIKYYGQAENGVHMAKAIFQQILRGGFKGRSVDEESPELWQDVGKLGGSGIGKNFLYRLDNGTLIDHIEQGKGLLVYQLLGLGELGTTVVPAVGLNSKSKGRKDIIAIHEKYLTPEQLYKIALISEQATINIIENREVVKKGRVMLPNVLEGVLQCQNQHCISWPEHYEHVPNKFKVENRSPLDGRCYYCETPMKREEATKALGERLLGQISENLRNGYF